jgi:integrase
VRGRIENTLDYAKTRGWRAGENPARWKGHLDHLLPARAKIARVVHHAALPWAELPAVMGELADAGGTSALCLRFTVLTAARSGESRGARWNEIDMAAKVWTVPPDRMKAAQEHRVPLSDAALAILAAVAPLKSAADSLVFQGGRKGKPLSDVAVSKALASVADGVTVHGMRSTFRDWAAESTNYPREVAEAALAHTNRDKVEAAYRRSDLFEQRTRLMREWAAFCLATKTPSLP